MGLMEAIEKEEKELESAIAAEEAGTQTLDKTIKEENDKNNDDDINDTQEGDTDAESDDDNSADAEDKTEDDSSNTDADEDDNSADADKKEPKTQAEKNNIAAQLRLERKEKLELQARLAEAEKQFKPQETSVEEGHTQDLTVEERIERIERIEADKRLHAEAIQEFNSIEKEFSARTPDYEAASAHMIQTLYSGIKALNPGVSDEIALKEVQNKVLNFASQAANRGQNPAEVLYHMAHEHYGFDASKVQKQAQNNLPKKTGKADNLKNVMKNKKKSASPLSGGGQNTGANVTMEEASKMDLASFGNLSESEIDNIINQAD